MHDAANPSGSPPELLSMETVRGRGSEERVSRICVPTDYRGGGKSEVGEFRLRIGPGEGSGGESNPACQGFLG